MIGGLVASAGAFHGGNAAAAGSGAGGRRSSSGTGMMTTMMKAMREALVNNPLQQQYSNSQAGRAAMVESLLRQGPVAPGR